VELTKRGEANLRHRAIRAEEERDQWREKCFNDTMAAKKSGYEDGKKEAEDAIERLKVALKQIRDCELSLRTNRATDHVFLRGLLEEQFSIAEDALAE
jgi:DNA invertase Pin-like site-specific DNA recombinase